MNKKKLAQLQEHITNRLHVGNDPGGYEGWEKNGKPCVWLLSEKSEDIEVYKDEGYGYLSAFNGDKLLGFSFSKVLDLSNGHGIVVLDKEFYKCTKYIWR